MAPGSQLRRFLVGFDGSAEAIEAIELAIHLGQFLEAEITLLSILPDTSHLETEDARERAERATRAQLDAHLVGPRSHAAEIGIDFLELVVVGGDPADTIARYAAEHGFDLVVVGSHGRDRATHGGLGRVVERLLREPRAPVLVAPARANR